MTLLIYGNRKEENLIWDISTPEKRFAGFIQLFKHLKDDWKVYECGEWGSSKEEQKLQKQLYKKALKGDGDAAEDLLQMRRDWEYEEWDFAESIGPTGE